MVQPWRPLGARRRLRSLTFVAGAGTCRRGEGSRPHPLLGTDGTDGTDAFSARLDDEHVEGRAVLGGLLRLDDLHVADPHTDQAPDLRGKGLTAGIGGD